MAILYEDALDPVISRQLPQLEAVEVLSQGLLTLPSRN